MTLTSSTTRLSYNGDGVTTSFAVSFIFWDVDDLRVILRDASGVETVWTRGTEYTVTRDEPSGPTTGSIEVETTPTDYTPASGETLVILSDLPNTQETSLALGGPFAASAVEQRFDQVTRLIQQSGEELDRALKFSEGSPDSGATFPDVTGNASKLFRVNAAADAIEAVDLADIDGTALTTPVAIADGGTGASTASGARTNLGIASLLADKVDVAGDTMTGNLTLSGSVPRLVFNDSDDGDGAQIIFGSTAGQLAIQPLSTNAASKEVIFRDSGGGNVDALKVVRSGTTNEIYARDDIAPDPTDDTDNDGLITPSGAKEAVAAHRIERGTAIATTSGTSHGFTGLPTGLDEITLILDGVSTTGTSELLVQIGIGAGYATGGYRSSAANGVQAQIATNGFVVMAGQAAANTHSGIIKLSRLTGDTWVAAGTVNEDDQNISSASSGSGGTKTLSGTLDRIRLTTVGGSDTFDAGQINIIYQ